MSSVRTWRLSMIIPKLDEIVCFLKGNYLLSPDPLDEYTIHTFMDMPM